MFKRGVLAGMLVRGSSNIRFGAGQLDWYFKRVSSFWSVGYFQVFWDHEFLAYEAS